MSLRDQLLAKGLVSKKRAKVLDREAKRDRKSKQAHRKKKAQVDAERRAAQAEADRAQQQRVLAARTAARKAQEIVDQQVKIRSLILGNRIPGKGPVPYYHRTEDGRTLHRLSLPPAVAGWLRAGRAAVVVLQHPGQDPEYMVINGGAASELSELAPHLVLAHVTDATGISAPDEAFLIRDWEPSLGPHRVPGSATAATSPQRDA